MPTPIPAPRPGIRLLQAQLVLLGVTCGVALGAAPPPGFQEPPQDESSKGYAFIAVVPPERAPFVGEPFVLRLRAGVDVDVLEANLVQPFRQPLDVPVQIDHPWLDGPHRPGGTLAALGPTRPAAPGAAEVSDLARLALGAEITSAARHVERGAEGRRFTVLELERTFVADAPGALAVPEARLGFAYALEFRDDLVAGRVALDRHDAFVRSPPVELVVRALPEAGRPFSFTGGVGRFELSATLAPERVGAGGTALLTLVLQGDGASDEALSRFSGPRLDRFADFEVVAQREATAGAVRTFEVELAPTREAARRGRGAVEPIELAVFDPMNERYVTLATPALALAIDASPETSDTGNGAPSSSSAPTSRGRFWLAVGAGAALAAVLAAALALVRRARAVR